MERKKIRGPSQATKDAEKYLKHHPGTSMRDLADRFKIDPSTVHRQSWWKNRDKKEKV